MKRIRLNQLSIFIKLTFVNAVALAVIVFWSGATIRDYACVLVNEFGMMGPLFNSELNVFFIQVSVFSFLIVFFIHLIFLKKIINPLKILTKQAALIQKGIYPEPLSIKAQDELGKLSAAFNSMAVTLQENEERKNRMLKDISHELRTPLTNLNGYLEGLQAGIIEPNPELYGMLLKESQRMTRLAEQINQLNNWTSYHSQEKKKISIQDVAMDVVESFQLKMEQLGIQVDTEIQQGMIYSNEDAIKQILFILLDNVCFYDQAGWVKIIGEVKNNQYILSVMNEGQPIKREDTKKVFERFHRADTSRKQQTGGAGLGLSIAQEIISALGGHIGLNTDGYRHSFWIQIPLSEMEE